MTLDLSTLQIPPADVVPEPTAEEWEALGVAFGFDKREYITDALGFLCSALRRYRALEAANTEHWPSSEPTSHQKRDVLYQLCKRIIGDKPNQWLSEAAIETIEKLEAEVSRLRYLLADRDREIGELITGAKT